MSAHGSEASDTSAGRAAKEMKAIIAKEKTGGFIHVYFLCKINSPKPNMVQP